MLRKTKKSPQVLNVLAARDRIQHMLGPDYAVAVPEQNPLTIGGQVLYRVEITTIATGEARGLHIAVSDEAGEFELDNLQLKDIVFPLNPFRSVISIEEAVIRRAS